MLEFEVQDMTCGHCESAIKKAVQGVAPDAVTTVVLAQHLVRVEGDLSADVVEQAIREAGFNPSLKA